MKREWASRRDRRDGDGWQDVYVTHSIFELISLTTTTATEFREYTIVPAYGNQHLMSGDP